MGAAASGDGWASADTCMSLHTDHLGFWRGLSSNPAAHRALCLRAALLLHFPSSQGCALLKLGL